MSTESSGPDDRYSDAEIRTVALAVISGVFFGGLAGGVAFPTLPLLDDILGISAVMLGLILAANRATRLVLNAPAGNVVDRLGTRRPMIGGLFVQALAPFGYVLGLHVPTTTVAVLPKIGPVSLPGAVFVGARGVFGVGSAFVFIGAFSIITHVTTEQNRGRWLGYMRGGQSLGFPTGLIVGGVVSDVLDTQTAFLLAGVLALMAGIVAMRALPDVQTVTDEQARLRDIPVMIRRSPRVLPLGVGNAAIRFVFGGIILATIADYAAFNEMQLSTLSAAGISGIVLAVGVVSMSVTTVVSGSVSDQLEDRATILIPAFLSIGAGLALIGFLPTLLALFSGAVLIGAGTGGSGPVMTAILGDITPGEELGRMGSVYNMLGDVGLSTGPLVAVPMAQSLGFTVTYYLSAIGIFGALAVVATPLLRHRIRSSAEPEIS